MLSETLSYSVHLALTKFQHEFSPISPIFSNLIHEMHSTSSKEIVQMFQKSPVLDSKHFTLSAAVSSATSVHTNGNKICYPLALRKN